MQSSPILNSSASECTDGSVSVESCSVDDAVCTFHVASMAINFESKMLSEWKYGERIYCQGKTTISQNKACVCEGDRLKGG